MKINVDVPVNSAKLSPMTFKFSTTKTFSQTEVDVAFIFTADFVDNGIGRYEFGSIKDTHHDWQWEFQGLEEVKLLETIPHAVRRTIRARDFHNRKAFRKAFRNECRLVVKSFSLSVFNSPRFEEELLVFASEQDFSD